MQQSADMRQCGSQPPNAVSVASWNPETETLTFPIVNTVEPFTPFSVLVPAPFLQLPHRSLSSFYPCSLSLAFCFSLVLVCFRLLVSSRSLPAITLPGFLRPICTGCLVLALQLLPQPRLCSCFYTTTPCCC
eukprot:3609772-Rhodomonas_salina.1